MCVGNTGIIMIEYSECLMKKIEHIYLLNILIPFLIRIKPFNFKKRRKDSPLLQNGSFCSCLELTHENE